MLRPGMIMLLMLLASSGIGMAADLAAGQAVFNRCRICHNLAAGPGNKVGPDLHGVFGRKAGTSDDFAYSPAMKQSGVVWSDDTLAQYLRNPREFIPGNRMAVPGIKDDSEIANLLAYLHSVAQ